jgi:hypothetical protein
MMISKGGIAGAVGDHVAVGIVGIAGRSGFYASYPFYWQLQIAL